MTYKPPRRPQFFYTTAPLPCPVRGRPHGAQGGDRDHRSGQRHACTTASLGPASAAATTSPTRRSARHATPASRSASRWRRSSRTARCAGWHATTPGSKATRCAARATAEQFQLFQRYQLARHGDGDMATMSFYDYRAMVEDTPIETGDHRVPRRRGQAGGRLPDRSSRRRAVRGVQLLRAGAGAAIPWQFRHPLADRARAQGAGACPTCISDTGCRRAPRWPTRPASARPKSSPAARGAC